MKILIVDDQQENLYLLNSLLQGHGHTTLNAANGQEALNLLSQEAVDLVVSDILMPVMDGFSLCREIRKNPAWGDLPFIIYTATYTGKQDEYLARQMGADDYIVKPCEPEEMLARINVLIENSRKGNHRKPQTSDTEEEILKLYNERLVRKLEIKMLEAENEVQERKKAIEALERSENLLRATQALAKVGGWEWILETNQMYWTKELYRMHDLDPQTCAESGKSLTELSMECYTKQDRVRIQNAITEMQEQGKPYELELNMITPKGREMTVRATAKAVYDDGKVVKVIGSLQDITALKQAEAEQNSLREQLIQAQKLDSIGQLAGGVAHDFNNILTVILGYAEEILQDLSEDDPLYHDIREIISAGSRASSLTRQLLTFSRKQITKPQILNMNKVITDMKNMLFRLIGEDIEFDLDLANDLCNIVADYGQMEQVLMNLVINSREAMPMGGRLSIKTFNFEADESFTSRHPMIKPGNYVALRIKDNGCGMDKHTKSHIFEPFFTTKEKGKGTGLGLPTVYGIIKQSEGHIHVDSSPGKGALFLILLPVCAEESYISGQETIQTPDQGSNELILVVEDDQAILDLTGKMISRLGYEVALAESADQALVLLEDQGLRPKVVITDIVMPGLNGLELAAIVRFKHPEMKVILFSGYTESVISSHGDFDRSIPFVQKPFTKSELAEAISRALRN